MRLKIRLSKYILSINVCKVGLDARVRRAEYAVTYTAIRRTILDVQTHVHDYPRVDRGDGDDDDP